MFVHQSDIYSEGFRSLRNQEPVEFGLDPIGDGRFKAVHVRPHPPSLRVTPFARLRNGNDTLYRVTATCDHLRLRFYWRLKDVWG